MSKPTTLRQQYGVLDILNKGSKSDGATRRARLMDVRYLGKPLGDHLPTYGTKEWDEAISFAHLAVAVGIAGDVVDIENRKPQEPDLAVTLAGGRQIYVEVAKVTASAAARAQSAMNDVNETLAVRYDADPTYAKALKGHYIEFRFPNAPNSRETCAIPDEMIAVFRTTDFATAQLKAFLKPDPVVAPILAKLGAKYYLARDGVTCIAANIDAHSFDPQESGDDFDERLQDKLTKTYSNVDGRPIWLALILTDRMQVPLLSMEAIRARLPSNLGQFDRLLVGTLEDAEMIVIS